MKNKIRGGPLREIIDRHDKPAEILIPYYVYNKNNTFSFGGLLSISSNRLNNSAVVPSQY